MHLLRSRLPTEFGVQPGDALKMLIYGAGDRKHFLFTCAGNGRTLPFVIPQVWSVLGSSYSLFDAYLGIQIITHAKAGERS